MIYLTILFSIFSIAAITMLFVTIYDIHNLKKVQRDKKVGFAELLNYSNIIEDGIILGKNGSLSVSYEYTCADSDSSTQDEKDNLSRILNQTFLRMSDGWSMHIDCVRSESDTYSKRSRSHFADVITQAIDEERRKYFNKLGNMFESKFYLTITYLPEKLSSQKFAEAMYVKDDTKPKSNDRTKSIIKEFKKKINEIENVLTIAVKLKRLCSYEQQTETEVITYDKQLEFLNFAINGNNQPIRLPKIPLFLDLILANQEFYTGTLPKIGNKYIKCVSIDGFPSESYSGILNLLTKLGCTYRWNTRFIFTSFQTSINEVEKYQRKWKQKVRGLISQIFNTESNINYDALHMTEDANQFLSEINSGEIGAGYYSSTVVLMDDNYEILEKEAQYLVKIITTLGFTARVETVNNVEAYLGSLPSDCYHNIRRPLIHTLNLAHLLPTSSIWTGLDHCPCPFYPENSPALMHAVTDGSSPFRLNLHVRDLGHTLILGPTGAGKSTLLATLAAQFKRYQNMTIFAFDKGMSMFALCAATNGSHYEICADDSMLQFCPLQYNKTSQDRDACAEWIISILQLNNINNTGIATPQQIQDVKTAIESMYNNNTKTLSHFYAACQNIDIKMIIQNYCGNSTMGKILDGKEDNLTFSNFSVFEMEEIMNQPDKNRIPILLYLFRRIQDNLKGQPAVIILDEAWIMLSNPVFREKIREWLKVLRKANCAVIMATQSISDAANSGIMDVINESVASKIFLPNATAKNEDTALMYKKFGLNDRQIEIIANAVPKRHYYYVSSEGARLFSLALQKLTLAFVAVSDKESIAEIKKLISTYKQDWVYKYLEDKKIKLKEYLND